MNRLHYIILTVMVLFIFGIGYVINLNQTNEESAKERIHSYKYMGKVKKLYRNKNNHNSLTIMLESGKNVPTLTPELFYKLKIGDSLYKAKNTVFMSVYRDDTLLCEFNHMHAEKLD